MSRKATIVLRANSTLSKYRHNERHLLPAMSRDLDEIRALTQSGDKEFNSYLLEKERYIHLLDAYNASLALVNEKNQPANQAVTTHSSMEAYGVSGEILYRMQQSQIVENLLSSVFTPNHRIFISYNQKDDPWWRGKRAEDIEVIRTRLLKDLIPRIVKIIKCCKFSDLQNNQA